MKDYKRVRWQSIPNVQCQGIKQWSSSWLIGQLYCRRENDPPTKPTISTTILKELTPVGTKIATLSSTDQQTTQRLTYTLRSTGSGSIYLFRISGTGLYNRFVPRLNHLKDSFHATSYSVKVRATDNGKPNMYSEQTFKITVQNVNDPPQQIRLSPWAIKEDKPIGSTVGALSAYDPDDPTNPSPCTWILLDDNSGFFSLSGNKVITAKALTHEAQHYHAIVVQCLDFGLPSQAATANIVIDVQDTQDPPISITISKTNVQENTKPGTLVGVVTALDQDLEKLAFAMYDRQSENGKKATSKFSLTSAACKSEPITSQHAQRMRCTSNLVVKGSLDFETGSWYSAIIWVRDASPASGHKAISINITIDDVNEKPTNITMDTTIVAEDAPGGSLISHFSVSQI